MPLTGPPEYGKLSQILLNASNAGGRLMDPKEKSVLEMMEKEGKPMRPGDIAQKAELDKEEVSRILARLKKEGKVSSPKRCFYAPA